MNDYKNEGMGFSEESMESPLVSVLLAEQWPFGTQEVRWCP